MFQNVWYKTSSFYKEGQNNILGQKNDFWAIYTKQSSNDFSDLRHDTSQIGRQDKS